ncbi:MAG TPA: GNAT family N-acetyltransferase [Solirubrobacteraceae bacterium]|jgi:GNAT superfamily N-acetyltransferase
MSVVTREDLDELLPLLRAYLDFYEVAPDDIDVQTLCETLIDDPRHEGVQLLARDGDGRAVGFATIFWSWSTLSAARIGVMNDLFVAPEARGTGVADALIAACADQCRVHGATVLEWTTALDNHRAQAVYDRVGGVASRWVSYELPVA